ncbi:MAG: hypothetical protein CMH22_09050 [Methylophaga sp.]|uniref:hypothetical protein n=1 Tax=Methylophaga sp. UBA678 TaxID=1946901 RepID=UPI000C3B5881|nr:hypothetical protein [Methylophaga sp. UBA678]MAX52118.1 hypothetical protein [Methylophaga sp.]|tara:strand:- start:1547 stop:2185 length:639 start_codon:yes stop_codon:yes gene_type:complete
MNKMIATIIFSFFSLPTFAAPVDIDLSGAASSTLIDADGASFSQTFTGQTASGAGISGSPTGPLSLTPSGTMSVAFWSPGCPGCDSGNSLLTPSSFQGPLSILFDFNADSFSWVMGGSVAGSNVTVDLFSNNGSLINTVLISMLEGYYKYSISGLGAFAGLTFRDNNDPAGVRYMDMSYNSVSEVPIPAAAFMFAPALLGFMGLRRRTKPAV